MLNLPGVRSSSSDQEMSRWPQGPRTWHTPGSVSPLSFHKALFPISVGSLGFSGSCVHFHILPVMLLDELIGFHESSRTISLCHQMAAQYHSRMERGGGGAMGLRDFGYVPLTKPSPEIRHQFLRISSTDTLKIKRSITMFCLSITTQQNNSTQPTGIKG